MARFCARSPELLIHTCQIVVGNLDVQSRFDASLLLTVTASLPETATVPERVVIRAVIASTIAHVISRTGIARYPEVASAFFRWTSSNPTADRWRADIGSLTTTLAQFLSECLPEATTPARDLRVARALAVIDGSYRDPHLRLRAVSADSALSPSRLVRLLQAETGVGFSANVHRRRLTEARRLLATTTSSIKEIAIAVGYGSSTQFARRFMRQYGRSPVAFRRAAQLPSTDRNN
jgi:AraC-like DNA-binding protein